MSAFVHVTLAGGLGERHIAAEAVAGFVEATGVSPTLVVYTTAGTLRVARLTAADFAKSLRAHLGDRLMHFGGDRYLNASHVASYEFVSGSPHVRIAGGAMIPVHPTTLQDLDAAITRALGSKGHQVQTG